MAIDIRAATTRDYDDLCALTDLVDALHRDHLGQLFQKPRGPVRNKEHVLDLLNDRDVGLFVATAASVAIGYVHVAVRSSPPVPIFVPRRYAVVENLVVDQHFRRSGVGQALMERAHLWAAAQGASEVELTVYEFNEPARAFYENLGYETRSRQMYLSLEQSLR